MEWKPISSAPGYFANEHGQMLGPTGKILNFWRHKDRKYYRVSITPPGGGRRTTDVHKLVCEAFHGPKPSENAVCMHLDETRTNNTPSNLRWGTQKENLNAPGFLKYCRSRVGENSPTIKAKRRSA